MKPKYRVCTRNFTNLLDEIEKVDYNFDIEDGESSEEEDDGQKLKYKLKKNGDHASEKKVDDKITVFHGSFNHLNDINKIMYFGAKEQQK